MNIKHILWKFYSFKMVLKNFKNWLDQILTIFCLHLSMLQKILMILESIFFSQISLLQI